MITILLPTTGFTQNSVIFLENLCYNGVKRTGVKGTGVKGTGVRHEEHFKIECRNYAEDGGWPPGVGLQERASNHLKLLR